VGPLREILQNARSMQIDAPIDGLITAGLVGQLRVDKELGSVSEAPSGEGWNRSIIKMNGC
jgi:hypothetical protein